MVPFLHGVVPPCTCAPENKPRELRIPVFAALARRMQSRAHGETHRTHHERRSRDDWADAPWSAPSRASASYARLPREPTSFRRTKSLAEKRGGPTAWPRSTRLPPNIQLLPKIAKTLPAWARGETSVHRSSQQRSHNHTRPLANPSKHHSQYIHHPAAAAAAWASSCTATPLARKGKRRITHESTQKTAGNKK